MANPSDRVRGQADLIKQASASTGVPSSVIAGIMDTEAGGPNSVSPAGAMGFMQVMPQHFQPGENGLDPATNIQRGAEILADNYKRYGSWDKAAAAYFGAIDSSGNILGGAQDARGTTGSTYVSKFQNNLQNYQTAPGATLMSAPPGNTAGQSLSDPNAQSTQGGPSGQQWLQIAEDQLSKPYIWGSTGGRSDFSQNPAGFDCSGFVSYVMKTGFGVDLPAFTGSAYQQTRALGPNEQPRPGDVVFYNMDSGDPHEQHIALYIGDGKIIQAGGTRQDVNIASANQPVGSAPEYRRPAALDNQRGNDLAQGVVGGVAQQAAVTPLSPLTAPLVAPPGIGQPAPTATGQGMPGLAAGLGAVGGVLPDITGALRPPQDWLGGLGAGAAEAALQPVSTAAQSLIKAQDLFDAVQNIGGPFSPGQPMGPEGVQPQAPAQPRSIGDILAENAMTAAGIPNIAGRALSDVGDLFSPVGGLVRQVQAAANAGLLPGANPLEAALGTPEQPSGLSNLIMQNALMQAIGAEPQIGPALTGGRTLSLDDLLNAPQGGLGGGLRGVTEAEREQLRAGQLPEGWGPAFNVGPLQIGPTPPMNVVASAPMQLGGVDITQPYSAAAEAQALLPNAPPVVRSTVEQLINPLNYGFGPMGLVAGGASGAGSELARQIAEQAGGDERAQLIAQLVGGVAGGLSPSALERAAPAALSQGLGLLDVFRPPEVAYASTRLQGPPLEGALEPALAEVGTQPGGLLSGATQAVQEAAQGVAAPLRNAPPEVQSLLRQFAGQMEAAKGQGEYLAKKAAQVLGADDNAAAAARFERTGQFVDNPTPEQQAFANEVQQFNQQTGAAGRAAGYIRGDVTAGGGSIQGAPEYYFPHAYEEGPTIGVGVGESIGPEGKGGLNPRGSYSQSRVFSTLEDAVANGYQPVDSVGQPLGNYARAVQQSQAKFDLVDQLKTAVPDGVQVLNPGDRLLNGFVPGAATDPQLTGLQFSQDIATPLQNILSRGDSANAVLRAMGTAKEVMLSLSPFHLVTELRQAYRANNPQDALPMIGRAVWNMWGPNWDRFVVQNHDLFQDAQQAGVTQLSQAISPDIEGRLTGVPGAVARGVFSGGFGFAGGYAETKREGGSDQDALMNGLEAGAITGALGATVARPLADAMFQRMIPTLKVLTYGLKQAGGADPQAAATFVNQTFGGQNLNMIARSQGVQNMLRTALLAPDWWEGWARQLGGAFSGGDIGTMSRGYWARTLAESALTLGVLNYAFSGHTADQNAPGHQFDLETTNLTHQFDPKTGEPLRTYVNVLGPLKDIFTLATAPWQPGGTLDTLGTLASNKLGLLPSTAKALAENQDFQGNPIVPAGTPEWKRPALIAENVLGNLAPVSAAQTMRENAQLGPGAAALTNLTGFRTTGQTPTQEQAANTRAMIANRETELRAFLEQDPVYQQMTPRQQEFEFQKRVGDLRASLNEWQQLGPTGALLANAGVTVPSTAHSTMNFRGKDVLLTQAEQQLHQQAFDQRLQQALRGYVNMPAFQQLPVNRQNQILQPIVNAAAQYANQRVIVAMGNPAARLAASPPSATAGGVAPYLASVGGIGSLTGAQPGFLQGFEPAQAYYEANRQALLQSLGV
jgi:cell wall-associated NlpC family hydrolase